MMGRLGVYGPILGRLPLRVFSIGKYAFQKKGPMNSANSSAATVAAGDGTVAAGDGVAIVPMAASSKTAMVSAMVFCG